MKPLSQTSNGINRAQEKVKRDMPESETAPKEKKPAKMTARPAKKSEQPELRSDSQHAPLSHSAPVTTSQRKNRRQSIPANLVKDMLSSKDGPFNRQQLLAFTLSPITEKDVRPIPRTWPVELLSAKDIWTWGDKLVKAHQGIFDKEGKQAYVNAVVTAIFPDDKNKPAHLPDKLEAFCLALDEQVIQHCRASGLTGEELDNLRMRVLGGFINGRVLCKHLRPAIIQEQTSQKEWQIDSDLLKAAADKLAISLDKIMAVNDELLSTVPAALPQVQKKLSPKMQVRKLLDRQSIIKIENSSYAEHFYQNAAIFLSSSVRNKRFMIFSLLSLYLQIPAHADKTYFLKLNKAVDFVYDNRHTLDKLNKESQYYLLNQFELISSPDRRNTLSTKAMMQALNFALDILPTVQEGDSESESLSQSASQ